VPILGYWSEKKRLLALCGSNRIACPPGVGCERHHWPLEFSPSSQELTNYDGMENYARWKRITKGLEPYGPQERHRMFRQHTENERKDREWAMRHSPIPGGATMLMFSTASFTDGPPPLFSNCSAGGTDG
jgi:hypothetical protein